MWFLPVKKRKGMVNLVIRVISLLAHVAFNSKLPSWKVEEFHDESFGFGFNSFGFVPKGMLVQGTLVVPESYGDLVDSVSLGPSRVHERSTQVLYIPVLSDCMRGPKLEILLELLANE